MAAGDYTLTELGVFSISGAALKTAVDAVNIPHASYVSGSRLLLIPVEEGQIKVSKVVVTL